MTVRINSAPAVGRVSRRPQHTFQLRSQPWQIQPFLIAPVLPGETLKNVLLQARCVTDPIKNALIGWWSEYYFFYVKHRDLDARDLLTAMVLDPTHDLTSLDSATNVSTYHVNGVATPAIDWATLCLNRITDTYFRNEGETTLQGQIGSLPSANISIQNWLDSAVNDADLQATDDVDLTSIVAGQGDATAKVMASEIDEVMRNYEFARLNNLTDMTYEDFLATYGVRPKKADIHKPELIRYVRDWSYPSNTIDPATGAPSSAVSWTTQERADKDRFLREPGFIFGVHVCRPKIYLKGISSSAVGVMTDAYSWLPSVLNSDPWSSMRKVSAGDPPLAANTGDYWLDIKDLLLYGDQFINFAQTATDANLVALPLATLAKRYATAADADGLFVTPLGSNLIRQDGVVSLTILGKQTDTSPNTVSVGT